MESELDVEENPLADKDEGLMLDPRSALADIPPPDPPVVYEPVPEPDEPDIGVVPMDPVPAVPEVAALADLFPALAPDIVAPLVPDATVLPDPMAPVVPAAVAAAAPVVPATAAAASLIVLLRLVVALPYWLDV